MNLPRECPHCPGRVLYEELTIGLFWELQCGRCKCRFEMVGRVKYASKECPAGLRAREQRQARLRRARVWNNQPWWVRD